MMTSTRSAQAWTCALIASTSSATIAFSASACPAAVKRSTSKAPDLSVSSVRVSDTVNTAIRSGWNGRLASIPAISAPALAVAEVSFRGFDPMGAAVAHLPFPEHRFRLQPVDEIISGIECGSPMDRRRTGEDDRLARGNGAAAVHHAHMADVEPLGACNRNVLERLTGERPGVGEEQGIHRIAFAGFGPREPDECHDCAVAPRRFSQLGKLELRVERLGLE